MIFEETLPVTSGRIPALEITIRSLVKCKTGYRVEWSESRGSWRAAWAMVDDCCFPREHVRIWSPAQQCDAVGRADDLYVPPDKRSGWWIIDLK